MDFWQDTNWFAVQTKPHQEKLAASHVAQLDVEVFYPRVRLGQSVCGRVHLLAKPLSSGNLFARFCPLLSLLAVQHASGVVRVVGTRELLIPLEAGGVENLQTRVEPDGFLMLEARPLHEGERVSIEIGAVAASVGRVEREWDYCIPVPDQADAERRVLGEVQQMFQDSAVLRGNHLRGSRANTPTELRSTLESEPSVTVKPKHTESLLRGYS